LKPPLKAIIEFFEHLVTTITRNLDHLVMQIQNDRGFWFGQVILYIYFGKLQ